MREMNLSLYQQNAGVNDRVINSASWQLDQWLRYLRKAKDVVKNQNREIRLRRVWFRIQGDSDSSYEETRYYWAPKGLREREARELEGKLFSEGTRKLYPDNESFKGADGIRIMERDPEEWYFILAEELEVKDKESQIGSESKKQKVRAKAKPDDDGIYGSVEEGWVAAWLRPDTYQLDRQIDALRALKERPLPSQQALLRLFGSPSEPYWSKPNPLKQVEDWKVLTDESFDGYDEQRLFVEKALASPDFSLLEGPPGSGKTTSIIELILQLVEQGQRVLLCSATHVAIDNVIFRMIEKKKYGNICERLVVPIRIGLDEKSVREEVRPYLLQKVVKTKKQQIRDRLLKDHALPSQDYLLKHLNKEKEDDFVAQLILEGANLVAGTMIGILQHPSIKSGKLLQSFDVLIVDEASKVTFQEFLVPALHAKKWVLVGDIQQLSPYVEDDYVSESLKSLIQDPIQRQFLVDSFHARRNLLRDKQYRELQVVFSNSPDKEVLDEMQKEGYVVSMKKGDTIDMAAKLRMNGADILVVPASAEAVTKTLNCLDVKAHFHNERLHACPGYNRQRWLHRGKLGTKAFESLPSDEEWESMLARQLETQYGYRYDPIKYAQSKAETKYLVPGSKTKDVRLVERVAFPSILEMLQRGVGMDNEQRDGTVFTNGLSDLAKKSRFQSLTYQHRMHEAIASCSREHFYKGDRLLTSTKVFNRTPLGYKENEGALVWVHNNDQSGHGDKIENPSEKEGIRLELEDIRAFAQNKGFNAGHPLEVAVLTFYKNQESLLRTMLRNFTGQKRHNRNFSLPGIKITLCTVDKFQGDEADIVLLSFTKASHGAFYHSPNRLNVALTRARYKLVLLGNREWMRKRARMEALKFLGEEFKSRITTKL